MSLPIITTIQTNINNLKSTKTDIKNAINTDYDFIANEQIESYPGLIKQGIAYYKNRVPHATKEGTDLSFNSVPLKFENMTIKGNTEQATSILPDTYTQVDYIESAGAGYIDSGVNADSNLSLEMDYEFTDISSQDKIYLGAIYNPSGTSYIRYHSALNNENLRFILRGTGTDVGTVDTNKHKWFISQEKFIFDGTERMRTDTVAFDTTVNFWLMGRNGNTESLKKYAYMKLYRCKMWYSNTLVRDFVPCYRNSDNEVGLYDIVNNIFYPNEGTGTFTYGAVAAIPNPDYPQDIHVVTGNNNVGVTGKNEISLLKNLRTISSSTTTSNVEANSFKMSGKGTWGSKSFLYDNTKTNQNYTISTRYTSTFSIPIRLTVYGTDVLEYTTNDLTSINQSATINTTANVPLDLSVQFNSGNYKYIVYRFWNNSSNTVLETNSDVLVDNIQLEQGSTATDYEPYYHQEYPVNLGSLELCKIGNYQDYLYKENGNWYKYKAIEKKIFDGTENWAKSSTTNYDRFVNSTLRNITGQLIGLCTHLKYNAQKTDLYTFWLDDSVNLTYRGRIVLDFSEYGATTLADFKTWLATNEPEFYIPFATPTTTQITDATLISQLEALDKAKGNNGTTIITSTGTDLAPILNFTAYLKEVE